MDTDYRLVRAGDSAALLDFMRAVSGDIFLFYAYLCGIEKQKT